MRSKQKIVGCLSVAAAYLIGKSTPLSVTLSLTGRCNYRCAYCNLWRQRKDRMTTEEILHLIDELANVGTQRVGFTQDEPLLHKDIGEIIDFCKNRGIFVTLGTNGSLVEEKIEKLRNIDALILSFDGPREIHDRHRMPGAHDNVIGAIETARRYGVNVWTTTVLTKHNLDCVDYVLKKAAEMDFRAAFQLLYHSPAVAGNTAAMLPTPQQYRQAIKRVFEMKRSGAPVINSYGMLSFLYHWPEYESPFFDVRRAHRRRLKCWGGCLFLHIESNGDVYPCSQLIGNPLNWRKVGLKKASERAYSGACTYCCLGADYIEYNMLFALNPEAIWNALKI